MQPLMFRKAAGRGAGSEQLCYLGYWGAIYLPDLTCFCSSWGAVQYGKAIALHIYLLCRPSSQTERGTILQVFRRVVPFKILPQHAMLRAPRS